MTRAYEPYAPPSGADGRWQTIDLGPTAKARPRPWAPPQWRLGPAPAACPSPGPP